LKVETKLSPRERERENTKGNKELHQVQVVIFQKKREEIFLLHSAQKKNPAGIDYLTE